MAATAVTDLFFEAKPRTTGKVGAGGVASTEATTIPHTFTGLTEGNAYIVTANRVDSTGTTKNAVSSTETFIGVVSSANFINCTRAVEGVAQAWAADTVLEILFTAAGWNKMIEGLEVAHNQDGTLKSGTVLTLPQINDTTADHQYVLGVSELEADRTVTLPLLTGNDEFVFKDHTQTLTNKTLTSPTVTSPTITGTPVLNGTWSGWVEANETWTYASADDPTFTFTVAGVDLTGKYSAGMRIKLTQTTAKYFIITAVAFSTDTTITVYGGTDYDLADAAITSPYYSTQKAPQGFPLDPDKWSVQVTDDTDRIQATPANNTWYNPGSISITIPIGVWKTSYKVVGYCAASSAVSTNAQITLSTANNSESNPEWSSYLWASGASGAVGVMAPCHVEDILNFSEKDVYYLNIQKPGATAAANIGFYNSTQQLKITAICAYL